MDLVQPLVALRSGSHEQVVVAAARASVRAWLASTEDPNWEVWLAGRFIKSVRRARPAEFVRVAAEAIACEEVGEAKVLSYAPAAMDEWWEPLRKLQAVGFERPREGRWPSEPGGPMLVIADEVVMSTGKTAAQVAHGLFAW